MRPLRIAIVGFGRLGRAYAAAIGDASDLELVSRDRLLRPHARTPPPYDPRLRVPLRETIRCHPALPPA